MYLQKHDVVLDTELSQQETIDAPQNTPCHKDSHSSPKENKNHVA